LPSEQMQDIVVLSPLQRVQEVKDVQLIHLNWHG